MLAYKHIDQNARIWLFGSRVDDDKRGGDIDIYIESTNISTPLKRKIALKTSLIEAIGEQKIDLKKHIKK